MEHIYKSIVCAHCGHLIRVPVYCGDRFCSLCSPGRQYRIQQKIKYLISRAHFPPGCFLAMLTVSLPNSPDLVEGIGKLQKSFRRLRQRKIWSRYIRGGLFVIEITGRPGNWHPHIHALIETKFLPWRALLEAWKSCSGGSALHIKKIPHGAAERYITKYLTKPEVFPEHLELIKNGLKNTRLFQPFGLWHGLIKHFIRPRVACPDCGGEIWQPLDALFNEVKHTPGTRESPLIPGRVAQMMRDNRDKAALGRQLDIEYKCSLYRKDGPYYA